MSRMGNYFMSLREDNWHFYDDEVEALQKQFDANEITKREYDLAMVQLTYDMKEQEDREDLIAAGRGHLLR